MEYTSPPSRQSEASSPPAKLALQQRGPENALVVETGDVAERVLASKSDGASLTLLEEFSIREHNHCRWRAAIALVCAAVSIAFAFMIYRTL